MQQNQPDPQPENFPCGVCHKNVNNNHNAFCCDLCDLWVHIRCNHLNKADYTRLQKDPRPFFCINCIKDALPHSNLTDNELSPLLSKGLILPDNVDSNIFKTNSPRIQSHIESLNAFLNKATLPPDENENDDDDEEFVSPINCNYYDYEEFNKAKFNSSKSFSVLHLNIHSIQLHIDSLKTLMLSLESDDFEFDIVAISESKI
jgi:hypothetical protein